MYSQKGEFLFEKNKSLYYIVFILLVPNINNIKNLKLSEFE